MSKAKVSCDSCRSKEKFTSEVTFHTKTLKDIQVNTHQHSYIRMFIDLMDQPLREV